MKVERTNAARCQRLIERYKSRKCDPRKLNRCSKFAHFKIDGINFCALHAGEVVLCEALKKGEI